MTTVAVVHTGPVPVQSIKEQISKQIPDARVINIVDDSLLNDVRAAGSRFRKHSVKIDELAMAVSAHANPDTVVASNRLAPRGLAISMATV
jgi:hypothetical protein